MAASFKDFGSQLGKFYSELSIERKVVFALVILAVFAAIYFMAVYAATPKYSVLYSNLKSSSASSIINKLHSYSIPYKLAERGKTILVPKDKVYETRLKLASIGLPHQAGVGFSIFDKVQIGMTDFIQHLDYQRALQGELERTIDELTQVKYSRVMIVLPRQSIFISRKVPAKASVIVKLRSGMSLNKMQVNGIVHLVASAVEGLTTKNVTIIDTDGQILSIPTKQTFDYTVNQLNYVRKIERNLEHKINSMLAPVVGTGNVNSKVYVKVDFSKKIESELTYNPNTTAIVSQEKSKSSATGAIKPYGIPGPKSNLPPGKTPIPVAKPSLHTASKETTNYDVSKKIEKISYPAGTIKRVYASVLINGTYKKVKSAAGKTTEAYVPRSSGEMSLFKSIVETAVGYSKTANDKVVVANIPFKKLSYTLTAPPKKTFISIIKSNMAELIKYAAVLMGIILLILLVLRPIMKYITAYDSKKNVKNTEVERLEALTQIKEQSIPKPEPNMKDVAANIVKTDPDAATNYVKTLLKETGREI